MVHHNSRGYCNACSSNCSQGGITHRDVKPENVMLTSLSNDAFCKVCWRSVGWVLYATVPSHYWHYQWCQNKNMRISRNCNFHGDMLRHNSNGTRWGLSPIVGRSRNVKSDHDISGYPIDEHQDVPMFHGLQQVIDFGLATPYKGRVKEFAGTVSCQQLH